MNKKGQTLALFVLMLPIISGLLALFIDCSISLYNKNKVSSIIESNLKVALNNNVTDTAEIEKVIKKNIDNINIDIDIIDDRIYIKAKVNEKSIFGHILDFDLYKFNFEYCGNYLKNDFNKGKEC